MYVCVSFKVRGFSCLNVDRISSYFEVSKNTKEEIIDNDN